MIAQEIAENIARVRATIAHAAERVGRTADEITLVAVSKTKPIELVQVAYNQSITNFGENRVQEALAKIEAFHPADVSWHMIGHLQTNKSAKVVGAFALIHSVDNLHLAQTLNRHAKAHALRQAILLQVNVAGEASKEGMTPEETPTLARQIASLPHLEIRGLMTIAPLVQNPEEVRPVFRGLRLLRDQLRDALADVNWSHLSMGMTDDYQIAIEEGATIVRVGRAIFGART